MAFFLLFRHLTAVVNPVKLSRVVDNKHKPPAMCAFNYARMILILTP